MAPYPRPVYCRSTAYGAIGIGGREFNVRMARLSAAVAMPEMPEGSGFGPITNSARPFCKERALLAHPKGFEPLTPRFVVWCSIQLSYGCALERGT